MERPPVDHTGKKHGRFPQCPRTGGIFVQVVVSPVTIHRREFHPYFPPDYLSVVAGIVLLRACGTEDGTKEQNEENYPSHTSLSAIFAHFSLQESDVAI
jgi:hypothetical protein